MKNFKKGFMAMVPITVGIIPFGLVMGSVSANAEITMDQTIWMNLIVFAGAAQLATVDLMLQQTELFVIVITGLVINLRFMLYSAAMSPIVQNSNLLVKFFAAYALTDQNYAVMSAHSDNLKDSEKLNFYFGASLCMYLNWQFSVVGGYMFGNIAPKALSLDYAIPLVFLALTLPALKSWKYVLVAAFASVMSLILYHMPLNLGLITTALMGVGLGAYITMDKKVKND